MEAEKKREMQERQHFSRKDESNIRPINREFLFFHRDKPNKCLKEDNLAKEMLSSLGQLSSKLDQVPVILVDKRKESEKCVKNSQLNGNSPSQLLSLMRSISQNRKRSNSNPKLEISDCVTTDTSSSSIFTVKNRTLDKEFKCSSQKKEKSFFQHFDSDSSFSDSAKPNLRSEFVDQKIFEQIVNKPDLKRPEEIKSIEKTIEITRSVFFLLLLLLVFWPLTILTKFLWILTKYLSGVFPNLDESCAFLDFVAQKLLECQENAIDYISFLN